MNNSVLLNVYKRCVYKRSIMLWVGSVVYAWRGSGVVVSCRLHHNKASRPLTRPGPPSPPYCAIYALCHLNGVEVIFIRIVKVFLYGLLEKCYGLFVFFVKVVIMLIESDDGFPSDRHDSQHNMTLRLLIYFYKRKCQID